MFTVHSSEKAKEAVLPRFRRFRTESNPMTPSVLLYESKERLHKRIFARAYGMPSRIRFNGMSAFPIYKKPLEQKIMSDAAGAFLRLGLVIVRMFVGMAIGMWIFAQVGMDISIGGALGAAVGFLVAAFTSED